MATGSDYLVPLSDADPIQGFSFTVPSSHCWGFWHSRESRLTVPFEQSISAFPHFPRRFHSSECAGLTNRRDCD